jgi:hypothetical protein
MVLLDKDGMMDNVQQHNICRNDTFWNKERMKRSVIFDAIGSGGCYCFH